MVGDRPRLSICVATYKRSGFIAATLATVFEDLPPNVEVLVVDGASPDDTASVVRGLQQGHPSLRYFREPVNSGVDQDYDKAVHYARGDYCWLMTDDDLLKPGAVARVLSALEQDSDLVVVNAELRDATLQRLLDERVLKVEKDRVYHPADADAFLAEVGNYLSFIGGVVIRRDAWLKRSNGEFFGTLFGHVGVIYAHGALLPALVLAEPLIVIRYGNAMWTARGFEIWMFKWPMLIWSLSPFPDWAKSRATPREPWRQLRKLVLYRGTGGYSFAEYSAFLRDRSRPGSRLAFKLVAWMPASWANFVGACYCYFVNPLARAVMYDLSRSPHASAASRLLARRLLR